MKDIGADERFGWTEALSVNDKGDIIGDGLAIADRNPHALRFAGGQVVDLNDEVDGLGDWQLWSATSVNTGARLAPMVSITVSGIPAAVQARACTHHST